MFEPLIKLKCQCGKQFYDSEMKEYLQKVTDCNIRVRAECPYCGKFIKWQAYARSKIVQAILKAAYDSNVDLIEKSIVRYENVLE